MTIEKFISIVESFGFAVHEYEENGVLCGYELETWTNGGVNMLLFIDCRNCPEVSVEFMIEELESAVCAFWSMKKSTFTARAKTIGTLLPFENRLRISKSTRRAWASFL